MTRIVVLGGAGMLGHKMFQLLRSRYPDTWCTVRGSIDDPGLRHIGLFQQGQVIEKIDAMDFDSIAACLHNLHPDVVVNCIGIIKQRQEAKAYIPSITINSLLPYKLAECCQTWGGRLIHFSTDCVFSGKQGCYTEEGLSDAEDLYGRSKYLGEVALPGALTLRTSIIGRELSHFQSLFEWFLAQEQQTIRGFKRAFFSGVTTNYLSRVVSDLIQDFPDLSGLYQVTSPVITKYSLLCLLRDAYQITAQILPDETHYCDRSMRGDAFRMATGFPEPTWPALVQELVDDPTPYSVWRTAICL
ncbi:MAG: dTDP-4-dehydrorhamnose reductase family protein [Armatimonadota bacterium]